MIFFLRKKSPRRAPATLAGRSFRLRALATQLEGMAIDWRKLGLSRHERRQLQRTQAAIVQRLVWLAENRRELRNYELWADTEQPL